MTPAEPAERRPTGFALYRLIRDARGFGPADKAILYTAATYANADGVGWPSVETVAHGAGLSPGGARRALARLHRAGVLVVIERATGGRGRSAVRRLDTGRLRALADEPAKAHPARTEGAPSARKPSRCAHKPPRCAPRTDHDHPHERTRRTDHPPGGPESRAARDGCDGGPESSPSGTADGGPEAVREALASAGVRGPNLDRLAAAPGLTAAMIREEITSIRRDQRIRKPAAVLVGRLSERVGVALPGKRGGPAQPVSAETAALVAQVEQARHNAGVEPVGRIGRGRA